MLIVNYDVKKTTGKFCLIITQYVLINYYIFNIDKDRHSVNSSYETSTPRGSGVHTVQKLLGQQYSTVLYSTVQKLQGLQYSTVQKLQGLQGFILKFDFGIYLDQIFSRHFAGVHINT